MMEAQNGICAACEIAKATDIDHNHRTHKVRGLICHSCNITIGFIERGEGKGTDADVYLNEYLKRYSSLTE